jgi:aminobenzoyl-glutamate utilization protein B
MTETEVEIVFDRAATNLLPNIALETAIHQNMVALGPMPFDEADIAFAKDIQKTLTPEAISSSIRLYQIKGDVFANSRLDGSTACISAFAISRGSHISVPARPMSAM